MLTTDQMQKLSAWHEIKEQVSSLSAQEMALRKEIAALLVPNNTVGTHSFPIGNSEYKAKLVLKETVSLDKDITPEKLGVVYQALTADGLTPVEAGELIKGEYKLSLTAYNKLSAKHQKMMSAVVTTKLSAPTLEIVPPKEEK